MSEKGPDGRFKPGHSGNPRGRPRKQPVNHAIPAQNRRAIFEIAQKKVSFRSGENSEEMTYYQAAMLQIANAAVKGDLKAAKIFVETVNRYAVIDLDSRVATRLHLDHVDELERKLERRERPGGVLVIDRDEPFLQQIREQPEQRVEDLAAEFLATPSKAQRLEPDNE